MCARETKGASLRPLREPLRPLRLALQLFDPDRFYIHELAYAELAQLSAIAGVLHTAKGQTRIGSDHAVDENGTCLEFVDETRSLLTIVGPGRCSQPKRRAVSQCDCFVEIGHAEKRSNRPK